MNKFVGIASAVIVSLSLTFCSAKPNDETIAKDIQAKITADPTTHDSQVSVESRDGKVTLKGTVPSAAAREQVQKLASQQPGVAAVNDHTMIAAASNTPPVASAIQSSSPQETAKVIPPPPPPPKPVVVPAGTVLTIRTNQELGSKSTPTGTAFTGSLAVPVTLDGKMVIPAGAAVAGVVREAKAAGRFKGGASLSLGIKAVTVKGHIYDVETEFFDQQSTGKGKRTTGMVVGGTGAGAAIGGIAGGGKGAAIGAVAGAAAGTIGAATGNRDIKLPAEAALSFKLVRPLTLSPDAGGE